MTATTPQTRTADQKTRDLEIAKEIIHQISTLGPQFRILGRNISVIRSALDIKGGTYSARENGVHIHNCLVSTAPKRRGNILITLTAADLYDVTFWHKASMQEETFEGLDVSQMINLLVERSVN